MSLHYFVKSEMLIGHVLLPSCQKKKLQNLSHHNWGAQICPIWMQVIARRGYYWKRRRTKCPSLI